MLYQIFTCVLENSVTISFIIVAVLLVRGLMCRLPKKYSYLLWAIVGIRLLCPDAVASSFSVLNIIEPRIGNIVSTASAEFKTDSSGNGHNGQPADNGPVTGVVELHEGRTNALPANGSISRDAAKNRNHTSGELPAAQVSAVVRYGAPVWLSGIAVLAFWNCYRMLRMKKSLYTAVRYQQDIFECDAVPAPFVMGLLHPKIYLPFRLDRKELAYILEHEQHHIRRRDYIIKPVAFMLACIYWFHPLIWLSYSLMSRDMEMSCDEYVLQHASMDIRRQYSQSLLAFALNQRRLSAGLAAFGETETRKRVKHVINFKKQNKRVGILAAVFIIITGTACLTNARNTQTNTANTVKSPNMRAETTKKSDSGLPETADAKKAVRMAETANSSEAVVAEEKIHDYQVQVVYLSDTVLPDKKDLEFGMYQGEFEIRTYKNGRKYASHKLKYGFTDELYYPADGFELAVKDYDGDGSEDDFAIGQGQTPVPELGNFMFYQFFAIEEDGSILQHSLSTEEQTGILTIPDAYSKHFAYIYGSISYPAFGEKGTSEQTAHITTKYQTPDGVPIQSYSDAEIQKAIKTVKKYFKNNFPGCSLQEIWYSEVRQQRTAGEFKEQYQADYVIILQSEFYVDKTCMLGSLEKDELYAGFNWILARNENEEWEVRDYGY